MGFFFLDTEKLYGVNKGAFKVLDYQLFCKQSSGNFFDQDLHGLKYSKQNLTGLGLKPAFSKPDLSAIFF